MKKFLILLFSTILFGAQAQQKADLIVHNGKIATMAKPGEFKQAIAVQNGLILATGSSAYILKLYKGPATKLINAGGKTLQKI